MPQYVQTPFESNPVAMLIYRTTDLQIMAVNTQALDLYGYSRTQMEHMSVEELCESPEEVRLMKPILGEDPISEGQSSSFIEHRTAKNHPVYVKVCSQPYQEDDECRLLLLENVTPEVTMSRQNRLLSSVARHTSNGVLITCPDRKIQWVNEAWTRMTGFSLEEVKGKKPGDVLQGPDTSSETVDKISHWLNNEDGFQAQVLNYRKNGTSFWSNIDVQPVHDENGQISHWIQIKEDISQYKALLQENRRLLEQEQSLRAKAEKSRAVFRDMFDEAPEGLALLEGPNHIFTYTNPAYRKMIGREKYEGIPVETVLPEAREQGFVDLLDHVYGTGEVYSAKEKHINIDRGDGSSRKLYINFSYNPLKDNNGEVYGIMAHVVDVSDQVTFRQQLEQQVKDKRMLLEEIHHRVKNNLAVITSLLYLQEEETDSPQVQKSLQEAQNRIQSIALIHKQLYQQAESEASIELSEYLNSLLEWLLQSSEPAGTELHTKVEAEPVRLPLARAVPLGMLTTELITNACKHAFYGQSQGEIRIELKKDSSFITLNVIDNGTGLPQDFNPDQGNTGMGLVQSLQSQLKAHFDYASTPHKGSTFTLQIPAEFSDSEATGT